MGIARTKNARIRVMSNSLIWCTSAPNDIDLVKQLGRSVLSLPIPCGDAWFSGRGVNSTLIQICAERKKIGDLAQCINDGRYLAQAQAAKEFGADVLVLVVEGRVRPNPEDGLLEIPVWGINPRTMRRAEIWTPVRPTMTYSRFCQYLFELSYLAGIFVVCTEDVKETASVIKALWDFFQSPPDKHQSLKTMFKLPTPVVQLIRPSLVRRIAAELEGIGWERSGAVAQHFKSVAEMVGADEKEWQKIDGIGKGIAKKVVQSIRNGVNNAKEGR